MPNDRTIDGPAALAEWAHDIGFAASPHYEQLTDRYGKIVLPVGAQIVDYDLDRYMPQPARPTGSTVHSTPASFIDYVNRHATPATTVWVHLIDPPADRASFAAATVILNDHRPDIRSAIDPDAAVLNPAGWGDHRATLNLTWSAAWRRWLAATGKYLDQEAFSELIEDGLAEIVEPAAADMLELAQSLHVSKSSEFTSDRRLTDGRVQFAYRQQQTATAGANGNLEIPTRITLRIQPFDGWPTAFNLSARFRYRMRSGTLTLGYIIDHLPETVLACQDELTTQFRALLAAETQVFHGRPRTA